jgi:hypothetical protein
MRKAKDFPSEQRADHKAKKTRKRLYFLRKHITESEEDPLDLHGVLKQRKYIETAYEPLSG